MAARDRGGGARGGAGRRKSLRDGRGGGRLEGGKSRDGRGANQSTAGEARGTTEATAKTAPTGSRRGGGGLRTRHAENKMTAQGVSTA